MKLKKGDKVQVIIGKAAGKSGAIEDIITRRAKDNLVHKRVVISGVNMVTRHQKPAGDRKGGRFEKPAAIDISNVMLVCPHCNLKTRVGFRMEKDAKVRFCKKCKKTI
jgi:large subunit ribosomal protein L24